jgi:hypothetical protein
MNAEENRRSRYGDLLQRRSQRKDRFDKVLHRGSHASDSSTKSYDSFRDSSLTNFSSSMNSSVNTTLMVGRSLSRS